MTNYPLTPGPVTVQNEVGGPPSFPASGVTGAPPQWTDGSDATYATVGIGLGDEFSANDYAVATVPQLTVDPATVTDIVTTVRFAALPHPNNPTGSANIGLFGLGPFASIELPADGVIRDGSFSLRGFAEAAGLDEATTAAAILQVATEFAAGPTQITGAVAGTYTPIVFVGRLYEVTVTAVTAGSLSPARRATTHPTRRFPRDDGGAMSSAARKFPPPRAGRLVGGYL